MSPTRPISAFLERYGAVSAVWEIFTGGGPLGWLIRGLGAVLGTGVGALSSFDPFAVFLVAAASAVLFGALFGVFRVMTTPKFGEPGGPIDYEKWDKIVWFRPWHAAWLWYEKTPPPVTNDDNRAASEADALIRHKFQDITQAIVNGEFPDHEELKNHEGEGDLGNKITRDDLIAWVERTGQEKPKFLFPRL